MLMTNCSSYSLFTNSWILSRCFSTCLLIAGVFTSRFKDSVLHTLNFDIIQANSTVQSVSIFNNDRLASLIAQLSAGSHLSPLFAKTCIILNNSRDFLLSKLLMPLHFGRQIQNTLVRLPFGDVQIIIISNISV